MATFDDDVTVKGNLRVTGTATMARTSGVQRGDLTQDPAKPYTIPLESWRKAADLAVNLPAAAGTNDLGLVTGSTYGTNTPTIQTSDAKATTVTQRMRRTYALPAEYQAGQTITFRAHAGMLTTVSDGTATLDVEAFKTNKEAGVDGADLVTTSAASINSLTMAEKDFTIDPATLEPGDTLDIRVTIAITDTSTGTAVKGILGDTALLLDVQG